MAAVVGDGPVATAAPPADARPAAPAAPARVVALDGLRGVAVAAVLAFHGGLPWARGGFLGVDVFFVLSGYLITTLLVDEGLATGRVRLGRFWRHRAARLLPPLLAVVAVTVAAWPALGDRSLDALRSDALAAVGYVANWQALASSAGYFGEAAAPSPLLHAWSLSVEEQFYVAWPLLVLVALRARRPLARVGWLAVAGAVASAVAMAAGDPATAYLGTHTRAQALLVGAALAAALAAPAGRSPAVAAVAARAGVVGAGVLGWAAVTVTGDTPWLYEGGFLVVAVAGGAVVAAAVLAPGSAVGTVLAARPLAALGRISYGVYLWHWPVFLVLNGERTGLAGGYLLAARSAVSILVAVVSFRLLELPVRRRRDRSPRALGLGLAAASLATALVAIACTSGGGGGSVAVTAPPPAPPSTTTTAAAAAGGELTAASPAADSASTTVPDRPAPAGDVRVLLVGDSVAWTMALGLPDGAPHGVDLVSQAVLGCGVVRGGPYRYFGAVEEQLPECETWTDQWAGWVAAHDPDVVAVLVGRWEVMDRVHDGEWTHVGEPAFDRYLAEELERMVPVLTSRGARIAVLTAPYYRRGERPDGGIFPEDEPERVDAWNAVLRSWATRHPGVVTVVDFGAAVTPGGEYTRDVNGVQVRSDGVHITPDGATWVAPWLFPQLAAIGRGGG